MVTIQVKSSCVVQGEVLGFKSLKESFISIYTQIKIQQNLYLTYIYIYIIVTQTTFFKKRNEWPPRISLTNGKSLVIELFWSSLSLTQYVMSEKTIFFFFSFSYMNLKKNILGQSYKSSTSVVWIFLGGGGGNVVNSVPYRPVRPEYIVPASNPVRSTPLFRIGKNTGRTGQFRAIPAGTGRTGRYRKKFFFFLSFVIFEFLLGKNGNLFALTYQYYLFSQYAMVTFKLSILFFFIFFPI